LATGEVSGDLQGANLAKELSKFDKDIELIGIGQEKMERAGVRLLFNNSSWGVVGLVEVFKLIPHLFKVLAKLKKILDKEKPSCLVLIDYPGFNLRLAKLAKAKFIPLIYYFPPLVWGRRGKRAQYVANLVNKVIATFPQEAKLYEQAGAKVVFVGHPLLDIVSPTEEGQETEDRGQKTSVISQQPAEETKDYGLWTMDHGLKSVISHQSSVISQQPAEETKDHGLWTMDYGLKSVISHQSSVISQQPAEETKDYGLKKEQPIIGLLPGSREQEVKSLLPIMLEAAGMLKKVMPEIQFLLPLASNYLKPLINKICEAKEVRCRIVENRTYEVISASSLIITCSGTATLEAAILETPMIIIYKVSFLTEIAARMVLKRVVIGMPNIMAGKMIVPELLQRRVNADNLCRLSLEILQNPDKIKEMRANLRKIKEQLGSRGAAKRAAQIVLEICK